VIPNDNFTASAKLTAWVGSETSLSVKTVEIKIIIFLINESIVTAKILTAPPDNPALRYFSFAKIEAHNE
jgi:hypothetical protein